MRQFSKLMTICFLSMFTLGINAQTNNSNASFQTPSGNIFCNFMGNALRCDLMSRTNKPPKKPADCPVDYGNAFELSNKGEATLLCYGDTIADPSSPKLAYGSKWTKNGITCESQTNGLTCTNQINRGFFISKANQKLF